MITAINHEPISVYVLGFAVLVLVTASRYLAPRWLRRRRAQAFLALRTELGLEPVDNAGEIPTDNLPFKMGLFEDGDQARNVMQGAVLGFRTLLFDYKHTVDVGAVGTEGGGSSERFYTVAAFESNRHNLARFELRKRKLLLARQKIRLEGDLEFSKRFTLTGADTADVGRLFTPQLLNFLVSANLSPKWHIEATGSWLIFWMKRVKPQKLARFFQDTSVIASGFFQNCGSVATEPRHHAA